MRYCWPLAIRRNLHDLTEVLRQKHDVQVATFEFDVLAIDTHGTFLDSLPILPDVVVCLVGRLGDQTLAEHCFVEADLILRSNLLGPASILSVVANRMENAGTVLSLGSAPLPAIGVGRQLYLRRRQSRTDDISIRVAPKARSHANPSGNH